MQFDDGPLTFVSKTYPRWSHVSRGYFAAHYQPTPLLRSILPWSSPPDVVVHLRKADGRSDARKGLDEETFHALGKELPRDTFLVTNSVEWYDWFAKNYGWRNPGWHEVKHSALKNKQWGARSNASAIEQRMERQYNVTADALQSLQLWSDWYTLASARRRALHTHSDFSLSALHWMNVPSKTIMGMRDATIADEKNSNGTIKVGDRILDLIDEEWIRDGETPRLIDRPLKTLKDCSAQELEALRDKIAEKEKRTKDERAKNERATIATGDGEKVADNGNGPIITSLPADLQKRVESRQYAYFTPKHS